MGALRQHLDSGGCRGWEFLVECTVQGGLRASGDGCVCAWRWKAELRHVTAQRQINAHRRLRVFAEVDRHPAAHFSGYGAHDGVGAGIIAGRAVKDRGGEIPLPQGVGLSGERVGDDVFQQRRVAFALGELRTPKDLAQRIADQLLLQRCQLDTLGKMFAAHGEKPPTL
jgi:hypothetical protein